MGPEAAAIAAASVLCVGGARGTIHELRRRRAERDTIFAPCRTVLGHPVSAIAPDGFPTLKGDWHGRAIRLALIPDTLTPRRLPQLWLALSAATSHRGGTLVVSARPRGDDYVTQTTGSLRPMDVPAWLPPDSGVKASSIGAREVSRLEGPLGDAFADPLLKEVALAPGRLRLLYRLAEGRRGAHLLLRQTSFDGATLSPALLRSLLDLVGGIEAALAGVAR